MDQPKRYETIKNVATFSSFALDVLILVLLIASGWTFRIRDFASSLSASPVIVVLVYVTIVGTLMKAAQLPLDFYRSYVVEHQFGLSRQTLRDWTGDQLKALVIGAPLAIAAVEIIYYLLRAHPGTWWLYGSAIFIAFFVVMTNLAPVLLLPLFFKFRPVQSADLNRRVNRLAERTRTRVCGIFEWSLGDKTRKANAAVVGWGNTRRIIVSDTLLENFSGQEIEVIMAHELCHHAKHHIWQTMALQSILTAGAFYGAHRLLEPLAAWIGFQGVSDIAAFPLFVLIMTVLSLFTLPIVNSFSRYLERAADLYALEVTGDSFAFVSCMEKLADLNLADKAPNKVIEFIFHSHPSIEERVQLAADYVGQIV